jgi:hypothetical protein
LARGKYKCGGVKLRSCLGINTNVVRVKLRSCQGINTDVMGVKLRSWLEVNTNVVGLNEILARGNYIRLNLIPTMFVFIPSQDLNLNPTTFVFTPKQDPNLTLPRLYLPLDRTSI